MVCGEQGQNLVSRQQCDREPVSAPGRVLPCVCCHAGTLRRAGAHLSNASSPPGEGEGRLRKEDRKGRVFAEMHKMDPLEPDFQSWTFKWHQLSCPCSETQ